MGGVTKHIFDRNIYDIKKMWREELIAISSILPAKYDEDKITELLEKYYPHEQQYVKDLYDYYTKKDRSIESWFGKKRYNMQQPKVILASLPLYKKLLSFTYQEQYNSKFDARRVEQSINLLWQKRQPKIEKINAKKNKALLKVQQVTPAFIDALIGCYEKKNQLQKNKVYIMNELKKYYNKKIINSFFKVNDIEINKQLRFEAFYYLQSLGYRPRLRKQKYMQVHTKNKKRKNYLKHVYSNETYTIDKSPEELEYRLDFREQRIKKFDFFISHSYKDHNSVQKLIKYENNNGKVIFCDWINDYDYLKRELLSDATFSVLKERLRQSDALIFVDSPNSSSSKYCKDELLFFRELGKPIYLMKKSSIDDGDFSMNIFKQNINELFKNKDNE